MLFVFIKEIWYNFKNKKGLSLKIYFVLLFMFVYLLSTGCSIKKNEAKKKNFSVSNGGSITEYNGKENPSKYITLDDFNSLKKNKITLLTQEKNLYDENFKSYYRVFGSDENIKFNSQCRIGIYDNTFYEKEYYENKLNGNGMYSKKIIFSLTFREKNIEMKIPLYDMRKIGEKTMYKTISSCIKMVIKEINIKKDSNISIYESI